LTDTLLFGLVAALLAVVVFGLGYALGRHDTQVRAGRRRAGTAE
jgi:hypothetical protein